MTKITRRRIHAFILAASMMICTFGFEHHAEASETGEQTDAAAGLVIPQNVHEENGFIVWDEVEGAYGYTIQASKGEDTWEYEWYENEIEWSRFIYEHCSMHDFGDYEFRVRAFDETRETTEFSSPVTVSYEATFSMPPNVTVVPEEQSAALRIEWDEVENAARYDIRIYRNDESHSLYTTYTSAYNSLYIGLWDEPGEYEYLVTVQAMDKDYHVSEWTEEIPVKIVISRLAAPQNVRFDESGKNIIWDEVAGADYYYVYVNGYSYHCEQPVLENWKRYIISPWNDWYDEKQNVYVYAYGNNYAASESSEYFEFEYTPVLDESITVPQIRLEDDYVTWDEAENAFRYLCRIMINGEIVDASSYGTEYTREFWLNRFPEGDHEIELCVIDEEGNYNSKIYPITLDTAHDESVWIPKLYHKFETLLWDFDQLRHPDTDRFWVRVRRQRDDAVVRLQRQYSDRYYGLMDLNDGDYIIDACVGQYGNDYKFGPWSDPMKIEKHENGLFEDENEITEEVEAPPEADDVPEEDRITSITINPAFNMKNKNDRDVELDLSKIKIKASEIYDEEGLKRAEAALGEVLNGNKHYNLLDLTLLYDGEDFSNGYEGLVKVIIPLPAGHRDKVFSCYRITETGEKEIIPGEQTEDSYIIYLEHFSEYALVAAGSEDPIEPEDPSGPEDPSEPEDPVEPEDPSGPEDPEEPHTHVYDSDWKSDAKGHWKECVECKEKIQESAHTQDAGTVTKEATKTETGIKTYKCTVCEYVMKTEIIPKLPAGEDTHTHIGFMYWKADANGHWKECLTCKDKFDEGVHTQDAGTVTKEATRTKTGIMTYKCMVCGYVMKTAEIAKLPADEKPVDNKIEISTETTVTEEQKKQNEVIMNKNVSSKIDSDSLTVTWNKLPDADGYDIYAALCSDSLKALTSSVGKNKTSAAIRKINGKKISRKKPYKIKVKAYRLLPNGQKQYLGTSAVMHVIGNLNKTTTNAKKISLEKKAYSLEQGKSAQIRATIIKADKKKKLLSQAHGAKLSYVSSDEAIATVTATGKIKAKKRGKCTIYVRALNGVNKTINVTVK